MKILASDFDGTLNYGGIDDRKRKAIARWQQAGNLFGLVSGRDLSDLVSITRNERVECDFFIANNGAVIADADGVIQNKICCTDEIAERLIDRLFAAGCPLVRVCPSPGLIHSTAEVCAAGESTWETMPPIPHFTQISTICANTADAVTLKDMVEACFGDYVDPLVNGPCLDIVPKGVDKAQGLYRLAEMYHVSPDAVIAVGDASNDTAMITAFRSYAMQNGESAILKLANAITPGVPELIKLELGNE